MEIGFINSPYSAEEDMGPMEFMIGVLNGFNLERSVGFSFVTGDIGSMLIAPMNVRRQYVIQI